MEKQSNDAKKPKKQHSAPARNWVGDNGKIIEPLFADYFLSLHPMRCFQGRLFTVDGMIEDEALLKKEIYEQIRYYATTSVARRIEHIVQALSWPVHLNHRRFRQTASMSETAHTLWTVTLPLKKNTA